MQDKDTYQLSPTTSSSALLVWVYGLIWTHNKHIGLLCTAQRSSSYIRRAFRSYRQLDIKVAPSSLFPHTYNDYSECTPGTSHDCLRLTEGTCMVDVHSKAMLSDICEEIARTAQLIFCMPESISLNPWWGYWMSLYDLESGDMHAACVQIAYTNKWSQSKHCTAGILVRTNVSANPNVRHDCQEVLQGLETILL